MINRPVDCVCSARVCLLPDLEHACHSTPPYILNNPCPTCCPTLIPLLRYVLRVTQAHPDAHGLPFKLDPRGQLCVIPSLPPSLHHEQPMSDVFPMRVGLCSPGRRRADAHRLARHSPQATSIRHSH
jgi:hypothetical protein